MNNIKKAKVTKIYCNHSPYVENHEGEKFQETWSECHEVGVQGVKQIEMMERTVARIWFEDKMIENHRVFEVQYKIEDDDDE